MLSRCRYKRKEEAANFENIRKNRSKILLIMYCVIVGTVTNKGNNNFCNLFLSNNAC